MKNKRLDLSYSQLKWETVFKRLLIVTSAILVVIVIGILITLIMQSMPSIKSLGIGYLWGKVWDPVNNIYGAYPFLIGTLLTSFTALIISIPFSDELNIVKKRMDDRHSCVLFNMYKFVFKISFFKIIR